MANAIKGEVSLVLADGRAFTLVLDMEAMLSIEEATGKPLPKVMAQAAEGFMTATASIAQAAFSRHHPEVTRGDVLEFIKSDSAALTEALGKAAEAAFPQAAAGNAGADARRPGKSSGRNGAKRG